jgi:hypothetical protein
MKPKNCSDKIMFRFLMMKTENISYQSFYRCLFFLNLSSAHLNVRLVSLAVSGSSRSRLNLNGLA